MKTMSSFLPTALVGVVFMAACGGGGGGQEVPKPPSDFTLTIPTPPGTRAGSTIKITVIANRVNGHTNAISMNLASNGKGITGSGSIAAGSATGIITCVVPGASLAGDSSLTINATDGALNHTASFTLTTLPYPPNFPAAGVVIGQPDFLSNMVNQGGSAMANSLNEPYGNPAMVNGILYIPDTFNHRVLGFNTVPSSNNASASFVLGQSDLTTATGGVTANKFGYPQTVKSFNGKLMVLEFLNSRVLIWNTAPTSYGVPADVVVGQPGFGSSVRAASQAGLNYPESMEVAGGRLIVSDSASHRVLIWNTIPTSNGAPADLVLGQSDFTHHQKNDDNQDGILDPTPSARTLWYPIGIWSDGTRLLIVDSENSRILIWTTFPTRSFQPADLVIGQGDFSHSAGNDDAQTGLSGTTPSARTLLAPYAIDSDGSSLYVGDAFNNRILIWDAIPTSNFAPANRVLGQADFTHRVLNDDNQDGVSDGAPSARTIGRPTGLLVSAGKLFATCLLNNRTLVFDNP